MEHHLASPTILITCSVDKLLMLLKERVFESHLVVGHRFVCLKRIVDGFQHQVHPVPIVRFVGNFR